MDNSSQRFTLTAFEHAPNNEDDNKSPPAFNLKRGKNKNGQTLVQGSDFDDLFTFDPNLAYCQLARQTLENDWYFWNVINYFR